MLAKWKAVSLGGNSNNGGGGGSKSPSTELTLESGTSQKRWNPLPSVRKPVWYTGWHGGVLACANSVVVVLLINVGLTIYAATNPEYKVEGGVGTLYSGSCDKSKKIGMWLHLGINVLSTLLLAGSNYTQQCLAAPARSEVDAAHARRQWMDIGVPSIRNLFWIKPERVLLWIAIGITSIPLHLLYNSAVYTTLAANKFIVAVVTNDHFEPGAYSNITQLSGTLESIYNVTDATWVNWAKHVDQELQLLGRVLADYNTGNKIYEDLTPSECTKLYNADFVSNHRNLFLITKHSSNALHNNTLLDLIINFGRTENATTRRWMCPDYSTFTHWVPGPGRCNRSAQPSYAARGVTLKVLLASGDVVEIGGCKSEKTAEKCKVQFSLGIMIAVICCNLVKACGMVLAVVRSREPTLVTLGDALDSFLRIPDPTTMGMCFADRQFVKREWRHGWKTGPREWKQKGAQRWWTSVNIKRWITCNFLCLITIIAAGLLLRSAIASDGGVENSATDIKSMWDRGFGKVSGGSLIAINFTNITQAILLANLPQTIISFLYLIYNSLFTCMLSGHEWSLFGHRHRTLRVTSPRPGQRSTYWLQIPYTYAIPLMVLSSLLHWLTSQSIFLARVEVSDPFGRQTSDTISAVGYSCIAIIFALALWTFALLTAVGMGFRSFAAETTTIGSCSAAISAACHVKEDPAAIVGMKVRWGDVGSLQNLGVRHLTFTSGEGVGKPMSGAIYAGMGEDRE